jgi:hypothetical protein
MKHLNRQPRTRRAIKRKLGILTFVILFVTGVSLAIHFSSRPIEQQADTQSLKASANIDAASQMQISYGSAEGGKLPFLKDAAVKSEFMGIKKLGFSQVRFDMTWDSIQPKDSPTYNWAVFDRIIADAAASGLKSNIILDKTPSWARIATCNTSAFCPPQDPSKFASFAALAVKRYGTKINSWEIWNEPNTYVFWKPSPDPVQYTNMLKVTYTAIKQQDPSATVLFGGLSGSTGDGDINHYDPRTFLTKAYAAGVKNYFDALAYHPYTNLRMPSIVASNNGWSKISTLSPSIRSIMTANSDGTKKLWLNEVGIPTNGPRAAYSDTSVAPTSAMDHVTEVVQSQFLSQVLTQSQAMPYVANVSWYSYIDVGTATTTTENFYGLVRQNGDKKPAYQVIHDALK